MQYHFYTPTEFNTTGKVIGIENCQSLAISKKLCHSPRFLIFAVASSMQPQPVSGQVYYIVGESSPPCHDHGSRVRRRGERLGCAHEWARRWRRKRVRRKGRRRPGIHLNGAIFSPLRLRTKPNFRARHWNFHSGNKRAKTHVVVHHSLHFCSRLFAVRTWKKLD